MNLLDIKKFTKILMRTELCRASLLAESGQSDSVELVATTDVLANQFSHSGLSRCAVVIDAWKQAHQTLLDNEVNR